jgi:hypothetical protein
MTEPGDKLYQRKGYLRPSRIEAYLEQYRLVHQYLPDSILEIGRGAGVFDFLVHQAGFQNCSIDIDISTKPNVVASVCSLPFKDRSFGMVFCCQVLEHLTFDSFTSTLQELMRICSSVLVISFPDYRKHLRFGITIPGWKFQRIISIPNTGLPISIESNHHHYWGIGHSSFLNNKSINTIKAHCTADKGFDLIKEYRLFERPSQHFFVLKRN